MNSGWLFILSALLIGVGTIYANVDNIRAYFSGSDGKKILKGILIFTSVGILAVWSRWALGGWFEYGEVYLGLDQTRGVSPQCIEGGVNDHITSNGGVRFNIYRSDDSLFHANTKYTHHSCALNQDRNGYDAIGVELNYRFYGN